MSSVKLEIGVSEEMGDTSDIKEQLNKRDIRSFTYEKCLESIKALGEKYAERGLSIVANYPVNKESKTKDKLNIMADGASLWRVLENLYNNAFKYAAEGSRVYIDMRKTEDGKAEFVIKNISASPLNISADELAERFVRGDVSRNTEGSGLGLSIAGSLTRIQGGEFRIEIDGDLFKAFIVFDLVE